ncbi:MAG: hypothetical protein Ct9H300mP27_11610 [Chloroflexota bacterium]|nr:MAG: hypothetical protein Ct9H300mP27_11610 [Chloroflexota bacterium]
MGLAIKEGNEVFITGTASKGVHPGGARPSTHRHAGGKPFPH